MCLSVFFSGFAFKARLAVQLFPKPLCSVSQSEMMLTEASCIPAGWVQLLVYIIPAKSLCDCIY